MRLPVGTRTARNGPERVVYGSAWVTVGLQEIEKPGSGQRFAQHTVTLPAAAMTVVLDQAREQVLLAWRHRWVPDVTGWELPGGLLDAGEAPEQTAARKVVEEIGYRPRELQHLVTFEPQVGMTRCSHHVSLAVGVEPVGAPSELDEGRFDWIPLATVPGLVRAGQVSNSGILVGLLYVCALGTTP